MLGIVLSVLKVIGLILLGIVAVILIVLFLALGVPVRYRGRLVCHDKPAATVQYSFLFHIVHVTVRYTWRKKTKTVRIFGIPVKRTGSEESSDDGKSPDDVPAVQEPAAEDMPIVDEGTADNAQQGKENDHADNARQSTENDPADNARQSTENDPADNARQSTENDPADTAQKSTEDVFAETFQQDTESQTSEEDKEGLVDTFEAMYNKYINERTLGMLGRIKKQLIRILRHILPRGPRGYLSFGFSNPAWTGYVLGILARLYPRIRRLKIEPDLETRCFDCDIWMHGHVRLGTVVLFLLLLVPNRDFRYVYRNIIKNKQ